MENKYYVYAHIRKDTNEIFYIGQGKDKRAYEKRSSKRSKHWSNIVNKYGYEVKFIDKNLTREQSLELEIFTINICRKRGISLVNKTDGGEGSSGIIVSIETRKKLSEARLGKKMPQISKSKLGVPRPDMMGNKHWMHKPENKQRMIVDNPMQREEVKSKFRGPLNSASRKVQWRTESGLTGICDTIRIAMKFANMHSHKHFSRQEKAKKSWGKHPQTQEKLYWSYL